jgi:F-type H+-transporting ATPase subunit b
LDKIDWTLWLQAGNFLLLIVILERLLYRPLQAILDQRRDGREEAVRRSTELEEQIAQQQRAYDEQLAQALQRVQQARAAALEQAQGEEARLVGQAHDDAAAVLERVRGEVAGQVQAEIERLPQLVARLGDRAAERLLGRSL